MSDTAAVLAHLKAARLFVQDCIENSFERASLANLYSARDELDAAIAKTAEENEMTAKEYYLRAHK